MLLDAWRAVFGRWKAPRIAIVDWDDVPTRSEFVLFQDYFAVLGLELRHRRSAGAWTTGAESCMPGDGPVDLIYKRVLINELVAARAGWTTRWSGRCATARCAW